MLKKSSSTTKKAVIKKVVTKVPVKKADIKKTAVKKTTPKASAAGIRKPLVYADNETSFWVANGYILNSLVALHEALLVMDATTFSHHANKHKNDFSEWVSDVLKDTACAEALKTATTPKRAALAVAKALKGYAY